MIWKQTKWNQRNQINEDEIELASVSIGPDPRPTDFEPILSCFFSLLVL